MKLILDEKTYEHLLDKKSIVPMGNGTFTVKIHCQDDGSTLFVPVVLKLEENDGAQLPDSFKNNVALIKEHFDNFVQSFPSTCKIEGFPENRTLRSDPMGKGIIRYHTLIIDHNLTPGDILMAMKYDVWSRLQITKKVGKNQLQYMPSLQPWLNDPLRVKTLIDKARRLKAKYNAEFDVNADDNGNVYDTALSELDDSNLFDDV